MFADAMSGYLNRYDVINIYNNTESLMIISPPEKLSQINLLHKIKDEEIYVIAFLPLKGLLKSSELFTSPKNFAFYNYKEIKEYYPSIYNSYLKWVPESQATKLIHLYKSNYAVFVKKWRATNTLLDYELFYPNKPKYFEGEPNSAKGARALNITALDFLLGYFRKNHNKIEAFIKELKTDGARPVQKLDS